MAKINTQLREIRKELNQSVFGADEPGVQRTDHAPPEIDALFDKVLRPPKLDHEDATIDACRGLFRFRLPTNWCKRPKIPAACTRTWSPSSSSSRPRNGGSHSSKSSVHLAAAGDPTSACVGAQAVDCASTTSRCTPTRAREHRRPGQGRVRTHARESDPEFRFKRLCQRA